MLHTHPEYRGISDIKAHGVSAISHYASRLSHVDAELFSNIRPGAAIALDTEIHGDTGNFIDYYTVLPTLPSLMEHADGSICTFYSYIRLWGGDIRSDFHVCRESVFFFALTTYELNIETHKGLILHV